MKTFHQDTEHSLKDKLKLAAENTMRKCVEAGKKLAPHISKRTIVFAAVAAMSLSGTDAHAQGLWKGFWGTLTKVYETVETVVDKIEKPVGEFNYQARRTESSIDRLEYSLYEADGHLGGALSATGRVITNAVNKNRANNVVMEDGSLPLIAEQGGQQRVVTRSGNSPVSSSREISLDDLVAASAKRNANTATASRPTSNKQVRSSTGMTIDGLADYQASVKSKVNNRAEQTVSEQTESTQAQTKQPQKDNGKTISLDEAWQLYQSSGYSK